MTKKTRRILFYSFILIFILFSVVIVLVAFGYGYDFTNYKIVKTGALGGKANTGASVYINDRFESGTSFLNNSFTKNRLVPGQYAVRLEAPSYQSWQKNIRVEAGVYTDFPNVTLIFNAPKTEGLVEGIPATSTLLYDKWLFYFNNKGFLSYQDISFATKPVTKEFDGVSGVIINKKFKNIKFDESRKTLLISSGTVSYLLNPTDGSTKILEKIPFSTNGPIYLRNNILYGLAGNQLMAYNIDTGLSKALVRGVRSFMGAEDSLVYIDNVARSFYTYSLSDSQTLKPLALEPGVTGIFKLIKSQVGDFVILKSGNSGALFKITTEQLTKVSDNVTGVQISPGGDKMLYYNKTELSILYLNSTSKQPYKQAGDKELVLQASRSLSNPVWYYDEEHLLAILDKTLIFTELDGRGNRNTYKLISDVSAFGFDKDSKTVYSARLGTVSKFTIN